MTARAGVAGQGATMMIRFIGRYTERGDHIHKEQRSQMDG
jgi:hypothetical protein